MYDDEWWESLYNEPYTGSLFINTDYEPGVIGKTINDGTDPNTGRPYGDTTPMYEENDPTNDGNSGTSGGGFASGLSDFWNSLGNALGSSATNYANNALNAATTNANKALANRYGTVTQNTNGTANVPASKSAPLVLIAGAVALVGIFFLIRRKL
jgi:hypothetical protein